jgi:hypothetical protein
MEIMLFGKRSREPEIKFDPDKQYAIIRSSICTGEKVAGFINQGAAALSATAPFWFAFSVRK